MFFANLIARTSNIMFGTAVINLPNHHPAIVAAEAAQFDHMSRGRFMLGVGPGGLVSDFELFQNPDVHARNRMVVEAVDFIEHIWSQDPPLELEGEFWSIVIKDAIVPELGIGFMPKPYQQPAGRRSRSRWRARLVLGAHSPRKGWGMISANIIPTYSVASHWEVYSEACAELGSEPRGDHWRVARNVLVAPSDARGAPSACSASSGSNRYFFTYMRDVLAASACSSSSSRDRTCPTSRRRSRP